jgi:hypothetical protein
VLNRESRLEFAAIRQFREGEHMPAKYTISLTANGPVPRKLATHAGDKITWINNVIVNGVGVSVQLTLPTCVSPHGTITIAPGASSKPYTVNNGIGSFNYYYSFPSKKVLAAQTGTIDVS